MNSASALLAGELIGMGALVGGMIVGNLANKLNDHKREKAERAKFARFDDTLRTINERRVSGLGIDMTSLYDEWHINTELTEDQLRSGIKPAQNIKPRGKASAVEFVGDGPQLDEAPAFSYPPFPGVKLYDQDSEAAARLRGEGD